jgi:hypothetical protein
MKPTTPLKAIRARCLVCMETLPEIKLCPFDGEQKPLCPLWAYRFGKNPKIQLYKLGTIPIWQKRKEQSTIDDKTNPLNSKTPEDTAKAEKRALFIAKLAAKANPRGYLPAIRAYCTWCCADQPYEVKLCPDVNCPLHQYRTGKKQKA